MSRRRRRIISGKVFELCLRARECLPLPPNKLINAIIKSVVSRAQRDFKIIICHDLWMSNHLHMIAVAMDNQQMVNFVKEVKKSITESIKRLLGLDYLHLWEGDSMIAEVADVEKVKEQIAYLYSNPSVADLEDSIEKYPGISSWKEFNEAISNIGAQTTTFEPWIRLPYLEKLPSASLSKHQVEFYTKRCVGKSKVKHKLTIEPNAWLKAFGIVDELEVTRHNQSIIEKVRQHELEARETRARKGKKVLGAHRLVEEAIMKPHKPKKKNRRIFVLSSNPVLRCSIIKSFKAMCDRLRDIYECWKVGDFSIPWPPGYFRPPMPPLANAI